MKTKLALSCLMVALVTLGATSAQAQMSATESIVGTIGPGGSLDLFFPNDYDRNHPKDLYFTGVVRNLDQTQPAFVDFYFDWIDPLNPGVVFTSPVVPINLTPLGVVNFGGPTPLDPPPITFQIPFCPPQVSVHFHNSGPGGPVVVDGQFTHICRGPMVPEPSSLLLAGLSLAGLGVVAWRRRK